MAPGHIIAWSIDLLYYSLSYPEVMAEGRLWLSYNLRLGHCKKKIIRRFLLLCAIGTVFVQSHSLVISYSHCKDYGLPVYQLNNGLARITLFLITIKLWLCPRTEKKFSFWNAISLQRESNTNHLQFQHISDLLDFQWNIF